MRYLIVLFTISGLSALAQSENTKFTDKDAFITCGVTSRDVVTGPLVDLHTTEFENLVSGVFKASRFPAFPYSMYRMNSAGYVRLGTQELDELDYHSYFLYNLDSISEFNLKARTKYGLMSIIAHEVGHHAFNHFFKSVKQSLRLQELQADYFAGLVLASFNVPRDEVTRGVTVIQNSGNKTTGYPVLKERMGAMLLGYDVGMQGPEMGPLAVLASGNTLDIDRIKKWSRIVKSIGDHTSVTGGIFDGKSKLVLDNAGQLIYLEKNQNFVVGRAILTKNPRQKFMIYDNFLNYWWVDNEGAIRDATENTILGRVDAAILQ